ncbi:MAG: Pirin domain protein [Chthonomonadales bacterium]|nr:Pirin domain protein [Chthonomonadales bacterium]
MSSGFRSVGIVMDPKEEHEGEGVLIRRTIGSERMVLLDPILLLDHLTVPPSSDAAEGIGFPRHPHRGIETLTYVLAGHVHHKDSRGNDSGVGAHGTQWMTAGRGIFHEEYLEPGESGCEALQIWFNLPAAEKMKPAGYRPAQAEEIPEVELAGGATVRVVAGVFEGKTGPLQGVAVDPTYLDVHLPAGVSVTLPARQGETALAYLYRGQAIFGTGDGATSVAAARLIVLCDGEGVQVTASAEEAARFIFVTARPLNEPVLQYRSLVMNTVEEMKQALDDLQNGTFDR